MESGGFGTSALVTGIIGLILLPPIFSTLAIIFGHIAIKKREKYGQAGLVLGLAGWAWFIFVLLFLFWVVSLIA